MKLSKIFGMLLDYDQDIDKPGIDGYEYHGFLGSSVDITTADPTDPYYYTLYRDGSVEKYKKGDVMRLDDLKIDQLPNTDYKLYSDVSITTAGYFVFSSEEDSVTDTKLITSLENAIYDMNNDEYRVEEVMDQNSNPGLFINISIAKYAGVHTVAQIMTIPELIKLNQTYRFFEKKKLPVDYNMTSDNSIYIFTRQRRCDSEFRSVDKISATNFVHMLLSKLQYENQNCNIEYKPIQVSKVFW